MRTSTVLLLLCLVLTGSARGETDEELAMRFYPERLDRLFRDNHPPERPIVRNVTVLRLDLDRSGRDDYLAAAYSNGLAAALRLIRGSADAAIVVAEARNATLGGRGTPELYVVDIENDKRPELVVGFWRETWMYKYENGELALFGPTRSTTAGETTNLGNATFFDLDGDGTLEILEEAPVSGDAAYTAHKLQDDGSFARISTPIIFADRFDRAEGEPQVVGRHFSASPGDYVLRITNGDQDKKNIVTAGEIRLNGKVVFGSSDFKKNVSNTFVIPVRLASQNSLSVELRSAPGSFLYVSLIRQ